MEQVMKKIPAILLAGFMAVAAAFAIGAFTAQEVHAAGLDKGKLYVGGQDIVAEGGTVKGDDNQGTATLTYDSDGNPVLTLNNYKCESSFYRYHQCWSVIQYNGDPQLTIHIKGENVLTAAGDVPNGITSMAPLVITGEEEGSLTVTGGINEKEQDSCGIDGVGGIQIQSGNITAKGNDIPSGNTSGISSRDGDVTINGGTVKAYGGNATYSFGIYVHEYSTVINGGDVTAAAGSGESDSYGICGPVTIGSDVTRVEIAGNSSAIFSTSTMKNYVPGQGWNNADGTGPATAIPINTEGARLNYRKVVFAPVLNLEITGNSSTVTYNAKEQSVSGYTVQYAVGDGAWTDQAPAGVSVKLKENLIAEAKGTDAKTYQMGLTEESFDIDYGPYNQGDVIVTDGVLTIEKAPLTIIAKDQNYVYNGSSQGPGDVIYENPDEIAEVFSTDGLEGDDTIASIELDGQTDKSDPGEYLGVLKPGDAVIKDAAGNDVTNNYNITYVNGNITITQKPSPPSKTSIDNAPVVLDETPLIYTGQPVTPVIRTIGGKRLQEGRDYTIRYTQGDTLIEAPTDAGTYTMTITGKGNYAGSTSTEFTIGKAAGTLTAEGSKVKAKSRTVKLKKAKKISAEMAYTIDGAIGELTFSKVSANKATKKFKVNAKAGQIKVKKGLKKGKYKLTVLITDSGDKNHEAAEAEAIVTIKIK